MTRRNLITAFIIIAIFAFALWALLPLNASLELVYQGYFSANTTEAQKAAAFDEAIQTIQQRTDTDEIEKSTVKRRGDDQIVVRLEDYTDTESAINLIGSLDRCNVVSFAEPFPYCRCKPSRNHRHVVLYFQTFILTFFDNSRAFYTKLFC